MALFAAAAGEDYQLLFCVEPQRWAAAAAACEAEGMTATRLGLVEEGAGLSLLDASGLPVSGVEGYEHG